MVARASGETAVANGALAHVGHPSIASIDEASTGATVARQRFADVRDALLRMHDWNFATAWAVLSADPQRAIGPLAIRYPLPDDCVLVRSVDELTIDEWAVEAAAVSPTQDAGDRMVLVTNAEAPRVCYTRIVENPALWDALFIDQMQLRLGAAIAPLIGRDSGKASELITRADNGLASVKRRDKREKAATEVSRSTSWITARRRGGWR